jgi:hypothetical protein
MADLGDSGSGVYNYSLMIFSIIYYPKNKYLNALDSIHDRS